MVIRSEFRLDSRKTKPFIPVPNSVAARQIRRHPRLATPSVLNAMNAMAN